MNIVVTVKQVPDLVEDLEIDTSGRSLDRDWLKFKMNEFDEHALEQALLLKEAHGGQVTVVGVDAGEIDDTLYTALAKGADRAVKIVGDFEAGLSSHQAARLLAGAIRGMDYDLVLTGVQAVDDLDGQVGPLLAAALGVPAVSVVAGVTLDGKTATVKKEFAGGLVAELEVDLPAVLGIQAAAQPPRYAPVSRVRQVMKTAVIEEVEAGDAGPAGVEVRRMFKPEAAGRAEMIEGGPEDVAERIVAILREKGILKG